MTASRVITAVVGQGVHAAGKPWRPPDSQHLEGMPAALAALMEVSDMAARACPCHGGGAGDTGKLVTVMASD